MKKTYSLRIEGKNRDRLLDAAKHDIRKYVKRERAKPLATGVDFWDFDCKLGTAEATAESVHIAEIISAIDVLVKGGSDQFYAEITSKAGHRTQRPMPESSIENTSEQS